MITFNKHQLLKVVVTEVALVRSEDFQLHRTTVRQGAGKLIQRAVGNLRISASSIAGGQLTRAHTAVSRLSKQCARKPRALVSLYLSYKSHPGCLFVTDDAVKPVIACRMSVCWIFISYLR